MPTPFAPPQLVTVKAESAHTFTLAGPAAVYGGVDLQGEFFTAATDFGLSWSKVRPLMYDHGHNPALGPAVLGLAELEQDEEAVWFEAELEKAKRYAREILGLAKAGLLGASIGAIAHLVERLPGRDGRGYLAAFPVGELSLTVTPAEPRLVGAIRAKALAIAPELLAAGPDPALAQLRAEVERHTARRRQYLLAERRRERLDVLELMELEDRRQAQRAHLLRI